MRDLKTTDAARALPEPIEEWWADFERSLRRRGRSTVTAQAYRKSFDRFWRRALAHGTAPDPGAVTYQTVNAWTDALGEEVSPATVAILWRNCRPFCSWWAKETESPNPFARADVPGVPETLIPVVTLADLRTLLATTAGKGFDDRRDNAAIMVLADCGVRLGEPADMSWDQYVTFLRSNYQAYSDAEVDAMIAEATTGPITLKDSDPQLSARFQREAAEKAARTPTQKRRDRRSTTVALLGGAVLIAGSVLGVYVSNRADPCSLVGRFSGRECAEDRNENDNDYYPGMEVCDVPPAAWGEPVTCNEIP